MNLFFFFFFFCLGTSKTLSLGEFDEYETHLIFKSIFHAYLRSLTFNLVQNYGVFTEIYVLQDLLQKKQKEKDK